MKPFNPWPAGILLAFALFIAGTVTLVVIASSQRSDLVRSDYYDHEVRHQQHMDTVARTRAVAPETRVTCDAPNNLILLSLPQAHASRASKGEIHFYRPSAANLDRHFRLDLDASGQQRIDARDFSAGLWQVRISWRVEDEELFHSQELVLHRH